MQRAIFNFFKIENKLRVSAKKVGNESMKYDCISRPTGSRYLVL